MFDHISKQVFLDLIGKIKYREKFDDVHEKLEFQFSTEKQHLIFWSQLITTSLTCLKVNKRNTRKRCEICSKLTLLKLSLTLNVFYIFF